MARNNLVYATSLTLFAGSFLQWRENKHAAAKTVKSGLGVAHPIRSLESSLAAQWIAIWLLSMVLAFTIDQAPEFGGPLTLLILIVALLKYASVFGATFNETQGKAK